MARGGFELSDAVAPLVIRIPLGLIFLAHGSQKLFGLFGGSGLTATFAILSRNWGFRRSLPCWRSLPNLAVD
jgi:putative oxidoreductase